MTDKHVQFRTSFSLAVMLGFGLVAAPLLAVRGAVAAEATATTQPSVAIDSTDEHAAVKSWFVDLTSRDASVRGNAFTSLMGLKIDDLPALKKVVEESRPLAPAQASVLRQIVMQVFLAGERYEANPAIGFLGVRMESVQISFRDLPPAPDGLPATPGIIIVERMAGFAAARMLRDGDVILSILDRPNANLRSPLEFAAIVKQMGAGSTVHFQVLRQGQIISVGVKLDPRPMEAEFNMGMNELLDRRRNRAEDFWTAEFAELVKEGVS